MRRGTIWSATVSLLLAARAAVPADDAVAPVLADPGAVRIRTCRLSLVSFRTREDGWVSDFCGHVYRTADSGVSWRRDRASEVAIFGPPRAPLEPPDPDDDTTDRPSEFQHLEFIRWLSATEAVAGGYIGARILRTVDAGKTWTPVPLPSDRGPGTPEEALSFESDDCGQDLPEGVGAATIMRTGRSPGYARAHGVASALRSILAERTSK